MKYRIENHSLFNVKLKDRIKNDLHISLREKIILLSATNSLIGILHFELKTNTMSARTAMDKIDISHINKHPLWL